MLSTDLFIYVGGSFCHVYILSMYYNQMSLLYYNRIQITLLICIIPIYSFIISRLFAERKRKKGAG